MFQATTSLNTVAVPFCAVIGMVIGSLWYGPMLFGNLWLKLTGFDAMTQAEFSKGARRSYAISFIGLLVMAYVVAYFVEAQGALQVDEGIILGLWLSLGFIAPVLATNYSFNDKPLKLLLIDAGYHIVVICSMGGILAVWQ